MVIRLSLLLLLSFTVDKPGYKFISHTEYPEYTYTSATSRQEIKVTRAAAPKFLDCCSTLCILIHVWSALMVPAIKGRVMSHLEFPQGPCRYMYMHICKPQQSKFIDDMRHACLLPGRGTSCPAHRDMRSQVPQRVKA